MASSRNSTASYRVLDAMEGPHGGRILRLRLQSGDTPAVRSLKGRRMKATSPDGATERFFRVEAFAVFGGRPSDERLARSGRVDVHVREEEAAGKPPIGLRWEVVGPVSD